MWKSKIMILLILVILASQTVAGPIDSLHNLGYVVVSPEGPGDGADFGPNTPGTQTGGIQEAFDYAKSNIKEVYIIGGPENETGNPVVYDVNETLTIPWGQDWHCDGGNYTMNFNITNGDCLVIDSQMNCMFKFGRIAAPALQSGSVVKYKPVTVGPDGFITGTSCIIKFNSIVGGGGISGEVFEGRGIGLHLDGSIGPVIYGEIFVGEILGCEKGILLNQIVSNNTISCPIVRSCDTLLEVNGGAWNKINASLQPDPNGVNVVGANLIACDQNIYTLAWLGSYDPGDALIFGSSARDNLVYAMGLPTNGVTNNASTPTNRIVPTKPVGFGITTPPITGSDNYILNSTCYSVIATILTSGTVTSWTIKDSSGITETINSGLLAGQTFYLEPGDAVKFIYSTPPTWAWRALR